MFQKMCEQKKVCHIKHGEIFVKVINIFLCSISLLKSLQGESWNGLLTLVCPTTVHISTKQFREFKIFHMNYRKSYYHMKNEENIIQGIFMVTFEIFF